MIFKKVFVLAIFLLLVIFSYSQSKIDSLFGKLDPQKWANAIEKKSEKLAAKIAVKTKKTLSKLQRQEENVYRRMLKGKDSLLARQKLAEIKEKYAAINNPSPSARGIYNPQLDSITTSLQFLNATGAGGKVKEALTKAQQLKQQFGSAETIQKFIKERREQLKQQLQSLGMMKELKKINKQVYYYSEQLKEYKSLLKDKSKREKKAMELLSKSKLYKDFFRKNSQLASLFRIPNPDESVNATSLAGLQTRAQVNSLIQSQVGSSGMQQFRQNVANAQGQLQQLKNKIIKSGGSSSGDETPEGFRPNNQKTKSFMKRIEVGTNLQTTRGNGYWPVTSDFGLSLGYKLSDKSMIGIGGSYKMGWGQNIRNIKITHQGVGIRSFVDVKIKKSLWLAGGYELNYRSVFNSVSQLQNLNAWQESGLIGLSKKVKFKSKKFKGTQMRLLWDFLSYQQLPRTQPIIFRIGYSFK